MSPFDRTSRLKLRKTRRGLISAVSRYRKLRVESLETRWLLSGSPMTWMSDSWEFLEDMDEAGKLSAGDRIAFGGVETFYGETGFGTVDSGTHTGKIEGFDQLQDAIGNTSEGGTLHVLPGLYEPNGMLEITTSLTLLGPQAGVEPRASQNSSRIANDETTEAIIDGGGMPTILRIDADDVVIDGLVFRNASDDMIDSPWNGVNGGMIQQPVVRYNILHDAGDEAVQLRHASEPLIEYNRVYDTAGDGINLAGCTNGVIRYNEVYDNHSVDAAIYVYGSSNTEIRGNLVYDVFGNDGIKLGSKLGVDSSLLPGGLIVDNVVHNVVQDGVTVYMSDVEVRENTVYNSSSENGAIYVAFEVSGVSLIRNHVFDNDAVGIRIGVDKPPSDVVLLSNTVHNNPVGVDVNQSTVLLEDNRLSGNQLGFRIQGGALVDAGLKQTASGGANLTGLTGGSNPDGSSRGLNVLTGYTGIAGNYAIVNLNRTQDGDPDVQAENNMFGTVDPGEIETVVYDDTDDPALTRVLVVPPAELVFAIDDGEPGYLETGAWSTGGMPGGFQGDYRFSAAGTGSDTATWTFDGIASGMYRVSATWLEHTNRATRAPFTIYDDDVKLDTQLVDQRNKPGDFFDMGVYWHNLGQLYPVDSNRLIIELTDDADSFVIADGIRIERVEDLRELVETGVVIIDNGDLGYSEVGTWITGGMAGGFNDDYRFSAPGTGSDVATWEFTDLPSGLYRVSATWLAHTNRATNAPYTIFDGSTLLDSVQVNQRLVPGDFVDEGVGWKDLGTSFSVTSNSLTVQLTDAANDYVIADAIQIARVGDLPEEPEEIDTWILDDGDLGYLEAGSWTTGGMAGGYNGDYRYSAAGDGSAVAEWKFTGVPSGSYRVSATWLAHTNRATDAPYTIFDDNTPLDSVQVNQQLVPGDFVDEGVGWQDLGGPHEIASGTLTVQLTDLADNFVIADAIRIEQLVEPSGHVAMLDPNSAVSGDLRQDHEVSLQVPADLFGGPAPVLDEARLASNSGSDKLFSELAESESPIRWEAAEREVAESWADGVTLSDEGQLLEEIIEDMLAIPLLKSARSS